MQYLSVGVTREDVERLPGTAPAALIAPELHGLLYDATLGPSGHSAQLLTVRIDGRAEAISYANRTRRQRCHRS